ncbi:MAG: hypothetical protein RLZZ491_47 [Pseudomonadota bacterium]
MDRSVNVIAACLMLFAPAVGAVGMDSDTPPPPTPTTTECEDGSVWDVERATCLPIVESRLPDRPAALIATVRELAYAGRHDDALALLHRAPDGNDPMVLTYFGYVTRQMGDVQAGLAYYDRALQVAPDNHLARAYLGLAHLQLGRADHAQAQLAQIRARGGRGSWPEQVLARALQTGDASTYDY